MTMKTQFKVVLFLLLNSVAMASFASAVHTTTCELKGKSFTVSLSSEMAPGSRLIYQTRLTEYSVNPDGTARVIRDDEEASISRIFDTKQKAKAFYHAHGIYLKNSVGDVFLFSLKNKILMVLDSNQEASKIMSWE